jgi:hypothetical protein
MNHRDNSVKALRHRLRERDRRSAAALRDRMESTVRASRPLWILPSREQVRCSMAM